MSRTRWDIQNDHNISVEQSIEIKAAVDELEAKKQAVIARKRAEAARHD